MLIIVVRLTAVIESVFFTEMAEIVTIVSQASTGCKFSKNFNTPIEISLNNTLKSLL